MLTPTPAKSSPPKFSCCFYRTDSSGVNALAFALLKEKGERCEGVATTITTIDGYYQRPSCKSFETSNSVDVAENIADERPEGQKESVLRFPSLFWAGVAAFACNAVLIAGIVLSPEMKV